MPFFLSKLTSCLSMSLIKTTFINIKYQSIFNLSVIYA